MSYDKYSDIKSSIKNDLDKVSQATKDAVEKDLPDDLYAIST